MQHPSHHPWPDNGPAHIPAPSSLEQQPLCFAQKVSSNFHNDNKPKPNCCLDKYSVKMPQINWSLQNMNYKINFRSFQSFWMFAGARAWKLHINWIHLFSFWQIWWLARRREKFLHFKFIEAHISFIRYEGRQLERWWKISVPRHAPRTVPSY